MVGPINIGQWPSLPDARKAARDEGYSLRDESPGSCQTKWMATPTTALTAKPSMGRADARRQRQHEDDLADGKTRTAPTPERKRSVRKEFNTAVINAAREMKNKNGKIYRVNCVASWNFAGSRTKPQDESSVSCGAKIIPNKTSTVSNTTIPEKSA